MTSIVTSRIGTGRSKLAVRRDRCVSPSSSAAFSMARHISAIGGPACWWSGCHGPRVKELGRYELPFNATYALEGIDSVVIAKAHSANALQKQIGVKLLASGDHRVGLEVIDTV